MTDSDTRLARRSFLAKAGLGAVTGAAIGGGTSDAFAQTPVGSAVFQPSRHAEDDWFDRLPGKHRLLLDATTPEGIGEAILFANNFYSGNKSGYGLDANELAVIICMRHFATAFAYTDEIWAKYGGALADRAHFVDPKTKTTPTLNVYLASGYGAVLPSLGTTLDSMLNRGVHVAVCQLSTRANATAIARQIGGAADTIYNELVAHVVANSHIVPAGIVAVNRAQERGYSIAFTG